MGRNLGGFIKLLFTRDERGAWRGWTRDRIICAKHVLREAKTCPLRRPHLEEPLPVHANAENTCERTWSRIMVRISDTPSGRRRVVSVCANAGVFAGAPTLHI